MKFAYFIIFIIIIALLFSYTFVLFHDIKRGKEYFYTGPRTNRYYIGIHIFLEELLHLKLHLAPLLLLLLSPSSQLLNHVLIKDSTFPSLKIFLSQTNSQAACFKLLPVGMNLLFFFSGFLAISSSGSPEPF